MAQSREAISAGIQRKLSELPDEARSMLVSALPRLQILQKDRWSKLAQLALEGSFSGYAFDAAQAGKDLGVSVEDARLLFNATGFLSAIATVFEGADFPLIVDVLVEAGFLTPEAAPRVLPFVGFLVENRESIAEDYEKSLLADTVLPTLQRFDTTVDLRLSKANAKRLRTAPVVVACVDTDAEGQIIWFQMSKSQVKRIMAQLEGVLEQLELAEGISLKFEEAGQDRGGE